MNNFYRSSRSKYHNKKTECDGIMFDSKREAARYRELKILLTVGEISDLRLQVPYELVPAFKVGSKTFRAIKYVADFVYRDKNGNEVVEDSKGMRTDVYKLKKKLMAYIHHIVIQEV